MAHEKSKTYEYDGRWVNIPSVEQSGENKGKPIPPDILKTHVGNKERWLDNKSYSTVDEAVEAAKKRSRSFDVPSVPGPPQSLLDAQMWQQPQRRGPTQWEPGYKGTDANPLAPLARMYKGTIDPVVRDLMNNPADALYLGAQAHPVGRIATGAGALGRLAVQGLKKLAPTSLAAGGVLASSASEAEGGKIKELSNLAFTIINKALSKEPTILKAGDKTIKTKKGFHERGHAVYRQLPDTMPESLKTAAANAAKQELGDPNEIAAAARLAKREYNRILEQRAREALKPSNRPHWLPPHPSLRGSR